jgi:hypothetical protein
MAFKRNLTLQSGVSGEYIRVAAFRWDRAAREASVLFSLFRDASTAAAGQPLVPIVAKLRLEGAKFDEWLANANLGNALQRIYQAARSEPLVSDYGQDLFGAAEDV